MSKRQSVEDWLAQGNVPKKLEYVEPEYRQSNKRGAFPRTRDGGPVPRLPEADHQYNWWTPWKWNSVKN